MSDWVWNGNVVCIYGMNFFVGWVGGLDRWFVDWKIVIWNFGCELEREFEKILEIFFCCVIEIVSI